MIINKNEVEIPIYRVTQKRQKAQRQEAEGRKEYFRLLHSKSKIKLWFLIGLHVRFNSNALLQPIPLHLNPGIVEPLA